MLTCILKGNKKAQCIRTGAGALDGPAKFDSLYRNLNIVDDLWMWRRAVHVISMEGMVPKLLMGNLTGSLRTPRMRWEDVVGVHYRSYECEDVGDWGGNGEEWRHLLSFPGPRRGCSSMGGGGNTKFRLCRGTDLSWRNHAGRSYADIILCHVNRYKYRF